MWEQLEMPLLWENQVKADMQMEKKEVFNFQQWWTHAQSKEGVMATSNANCHCWFS